MTLFELWFYFVAIPSIKEWMVLFVVVGFIAGFVSFSLYLFKEDCDIKQSGLSFKPFLWVSVMSMLIGLPLSLLPDEKQIMLLTGGYVVTNTEGVNELPDNIVNAANNFLKDYTKE